MNFPLAPNVGARCELFKPNDTLLPDKWHAHATEDGVLRCYLGAVEECPEFRRRRVLSTLRQGVPI